MATWLHPLVKLWAVPLTACRRGLAVALLRTSSRRDRATRGDRSGCSATRARGACSTHVTGAHGGSCLHADASAEPTCSPSPTEKDSATALSVALSFTPGSPHGALDLVSAFGTVLIAEVRAARDLGHDGLEETLENLLVAVLATAEVITEDHAA